LNELALFAGAGGGILGGQLLGWRTVCAVEWEPYPASVLCARQNEKLLPHFPIWDDVQTFDGKPWRGIVDVISGGFPCQDISCAGKGAGIEGKRSGMWKEFARIISEVQPKYVFVENSPMLTFRGLGTVLGDLSEMGFDAEWGVLSAADVGANHRRERIWILAYERSVAHPDSARCEGLRNSPKRGTKEISVPSFQSWWETEPKVGRVDNGVAARVDRLKAIGNGQVLLCAATAFKLLRERLK
jgi:DNA (cytosine-5)-methyltransferase 1